MSSIIIKGCTPAVSSSACLKVRWAPGSAKYIFGLLYPTERWRVPRPSSIPFVLLSSAKTTMAVCRYDYHALTQIDTFRRSGSPLSSRPLPYLVHSPVFLRMALFACKASGTDLDGRGYLFWRDCLLFFLESLHTLFFLARHHTLDSFPRRKKLM